jgi:branched-subunit amino acid transport protein AzlD
LTQAWLIIPAALAGVLAPKLLPWLFLPANPPESMTRRLRLLPPATLGAFTALTAAQWITGYPRPLAPVAALAVTLLVALVARHTLIALAVGTVLVVGLHLAGLA